MMNNDTNFSKLTDEELDKVTGGIIWPGFGMCLLQKGAGADPNLAELVRDIRAKDWDALARATSKAIISSNPIVVDCLVNN